jgi:hypothetical protein
VDLVSSVLRLVPAVCLVLTFSVVFDWDSTEGAITTTKTSPQVTAPLIRKALRFFRRYDTSSLSLICPLSGRGRVAHQLGCDSPTAAFAAENPKVKILEGWLILLSFRFHLLARIIDKVPNTPSISLNINVL